MATISGRLVGADGSAGRGYTGYWVEATVGVAQSAEVRAFDASVADDGAFAISLDDLVPAGAATLTVRAPGGRRAAMQDMAVDQPLDIRVTPDGGFVPEVDEAAPAGALGPLVLRVSVTNRDDAGRAARRLVSIWERRADEGSPADAPPRTVVGAAYTDANGRARIEIDRRAYGPLDIEVAGDLAGTRTELARADGLPVTNAAVTARFAEAAPAPDNKACDCAVPSPPRAPDHDDLVGVDGVYSADLGGGCVTLTVPNRTIEEYRYTMLVRTSDPQLHRDDRRYLPLSEEVLQVLGEVSFGANAIDSALGGSSVRRVENAAAGVAAAAEPPVSLEALRENSEAYRGSGLLAARAWRDVANLSVAQRTLLSKASDLSEDTLRHALSDPDGFTPVSLMTAERRGSIDRLRHELGRAVLGTGLRGPVTAGNPMRWEDNNGPGQAATVAHGHVLGYRQVWKADGYSLGDCVYSLPLAPGQKRKIVVLDWDRQEAAQRNESRVASEQLSADLSRSRDVAEIVNSTITENIRAGSSAKSWGAGGGIGLGIPIGAGFLGLGVAGGGGGASSQAWQDSARALAASTGQQLSDRTQQAASAVRSQRGTVVATRTQNESVSVVSEVVANYNHCHAITIEYFEVLKHYRVEQELISVQECLFVPLLMSRFDTYKALRWRDTIGGFLIDPSLSGGFDAAARIVSGYADVDVPTARYADEPVVEMWGEFRVELSLARPRDPAEGEAVAGYISSAWNFWDVLFGLGAADQAYRTFIAGQKFADQVWADELAPRLAHAFFDHLILQVDVAGAGNTIVTYAVPADFTLVSRYRPGARHLVAFKVHSLPFTATRIAIRGVRILSATNLSPNSTAIVRTFQTSYRNAYRSFALVAPRGVRDDLRPGDPAYIPTLSLSRAEVFNPREDDQNQWNELARHLNEHLEHYHRLIWWRMDPGRRFMLLDGFTAPNGRSIASVTENRILDIVGNAIVLPVAPGYHLDPLLAQPAPDAKPVDLLAIYRPVVPIPPRRVSVPTRGVHAEAISGECNSCERHDNRRFWDWATEPTGDEPGDIGETDTGTRRQEPTGDKPTAFPQPIVAIQNAPAAPDPTGFGALTALLGQKDLFTDVTGLEMNQKNALAAFQGAMKTANSFGKLAASGAKQIHAQQNSDRILQKARDANAQGHLGDSDARAVYDATIKAMNGDRGKPGKPLTDQSAVKDAMDTVAAGQGKRSMTVTSGDATKSQSVDVNFGDGAPKPPALSYKVGGIVPTIAQELPKGCWAAALTMIKSWKRNQSFAIETLLAEAPGDYVARYTEDRGLAPGDVAKLREDFELRNASTPLTAVELAARLKERGPLWVIADEDPSASFSVHARVVTGLEGDGTAAGTKIFYNDPSSGTAKVETLQAFIVKMEQLATGMVSTFGTVSAQMLSN